MVSGGEDTDADWVINIREIVPFACTEDVAFWYFMVEVPKGSIQDDDEVKFKEVNDSYRVGLYSGNVQYIRTDEYADTDEEKKPYYLMESREELMDYCEIHGFAGFVEMPSYDYATGEKIDRISPEDEINIVFKVYNELESGSI